MTAAIEPTLIVPGLWMGGEGIIPMPPDGFDVVVSLRDIGDWHPPVFDQEGPVYLWMPLIDENKAPPVWKVLLGAKTVAQVLSEQKTVLVHCAQGHNRSGLIVGATLIETMGFTPAGAINLIRERRPGALSNIAFVAALMSLDVV